MTMFKNSPDAFVMEKVSENFEFLTGVRLPELKKKGMTHVDGNTVADHFAGGPKFVHMVIFFQAFTEAKARGLLTPVEVEKCDALVAVLSEA